MLHVLVKTWYTSLFNFTHSNQCTLVLIVNLIDISPMTNDTKHIFMYLFAITISSFNKYLFKFFIGLFYYRTLLFIINSAPKSIIRYMLCNDFLPICAFSFHCNNGFEKQKFYIFIRFIFF